MQLNLFFQAKMLMLSSITIKSNSTLTANDETVAELFNKYFIIETQLARHLVQVIFQTQRIIREYEQHSSILKTKEFLKELNIFELPTANTAEINNIVKSWNTKKEMRGNAIPPKLLKIAADVTNLILQIY